MKRVILLEGNLIMSSKIVSLLRSLGYDVKTVQRWKALEGLLEEVKPKLVLINIEGIEGIEPLRKLKESKPEIPVVVYCSHRNTELQEEARRLGAEAVVPNSLVVSGLGEIVGRLIV
jgi:CheY-like chemotaxis protein